MLQPVSYATARQYLVDCMLAKLVPMLHGSPGIGKSALAHSIAKEYNLKVIDLRLSQVEPTDLNGFAIPDIKSGVARYLPLDTFPLEGSAKPKGYDGWLLFLDEFNSAPLSVQKAAYKLSLDRMVGQQKLHPNVAIMCAGNLATDNAIVSDLSTAQQSRLVHIILEKRQHQAWIDWAISSGIDHRITDYIKYRPDMVNNFSPDHNDYTFACQRTWEFVSRLIKNWPDITQEKHQLLAGTVGAGVAMEFIQFSKVYKQLATIEDIEKNPSSARLPNEPSSQYAMTGILANYVNEKNQDPVIQYMERLPKEFQMICLKEAIKRFPPLTNHPTVTRVITEVADII